MVSNLSVLIPARNEEPNIKILLPQLLEKYKNYIREIILINDCSTDGTQKVLRQLKKKFPKIKSINRRYNPGVGNALKEGIKNLSTRSKYVLFMDCDFLANINDIDKMIRHIGEFDGIIGSRFIRKNSLVSYPPLKRVVNRLYHHLARILLKIPNSDLTNNFKLYRTSLVKRIYPLLTASDFACNAELGFYPVLMHARITEIPVSWQERTKQMGLSKFKILKVGPSYLKVFIHLLNFKNKK
ncbi:hypothetical protein A2W14_02830 [Candidatus Gottesmanbacteria bacterium RBG_16_37_8]|uniref:Glycosyltransferase 2-like domain-containing protein n=1 Tax=Candidatus Gottesmanbacteria bacterium RBG_16_37_8 TaxID=1798371 RepID=A0A1F5YT60_9BACT|nr:MAG: hypothetical protein A2W14_02830 [Candidatus Gottesmanbacteria bacterium RBG_16_37_8]